jgi:hypothetical protein
LIYVKVPRTAPRYWDLIDPNGYVDSADFRANCEVVNVNIEVPEPLSCGLADIRQRRGVRCHFNRSEGQRKHPGRGLAPFSENEV